MSIRLEDVALAVIVVGVPFLEPLHSLLPFVGDQSNPVGGVLSLIAVIGAIVAMATRVPGETRVESRTPGMQPERLWMIGPYIGAVGILGVDSLDRLGRPGGDALAGVAFIVVLASVLLADRLPVVSRRTRRMLVAPFVLLSGAFLQSLVSDMVEGLGGESGPMARLLDSEQPLLLVHILGILAFAAAIFYMMLIFVPRELADPGASNLAWIARFVLFYASLLAAVLIDADIPILFT